MLCNFQGASVDPRDKLCRTPLFLAAEEGATDSVQILIDSGADVTIKDVDMRSCVRVAVGHTATMEVLLQVTDYLIKVETLLRNRRIRTFIHLPRIQQNITRAD